MSKRHQAFEEYKRRAELDNGCLETDLLAVDLRGNLHSYTVPTGRILEKGPEFHLLLGDRTPDMPAELVLVPDWASTFHDPFGRRPMAVFCYLMAPSPEGKGAYYRYDPRAIARRAEQYMRKMKIATESQWGVELQFFLGKRHDEEWAPLDSHRSRAVRTQIAETLERAEIEFFRHREVTPGLCAFTLPHKPLLAACDQLTIAKYAIARICEEEKLRVEFLPTVPWAREVMAGMHIHASLWKREKPLFSDASAKHGFSLLTGWFVNGLAQNAAALKPLMTPAFAAEPGVTRWNMTIRTPHDLGDEKARRVAVLVPDPSANPYLAFAGLLMAGLDGGIGKSVHDWQDRLPLHEPQLLMLDTNAQNDTSFLREGNVFSEAILHALLQPETPKP